MDHVLTITQYWIDPLLENQVIPEENREQFIQDLFWNMREVHDVNAELANALESRQKASSPIVDQICDIMLQHVASFGPFVQYGAHQMVSRYVLETEKSTNPAFTEFVEVNVKLFMQAHTHKKFMQRIFRLQKDYHNHASWN